MRNVLKTLSTCLCLRTNPLTSTRSVQIQYKKLLSNSITTSYQKIKDDSILDDIDKEAKKIAQNLKLEDRIECFPYREAFITLKDHKENFHNKPSSHIINLAESELGKIA